MYTEDTELTPISELFNEVPGKGTKTYELAKNAVKETRQLLYESGVYNQLPAILESMRRVTNIFYGAKQSVSPGYTTPEIVGNRLEDVLFDLNACGNNDCTKNMVLRAFTTMRRLEIAFTEFSEHKAMLVQSGFSELYPDEIQNVAHQMLTRSIWWGWKPVGNNLEEDTMYLLQYIWGTLNYLPNVLAATSKKTPFQYEDFQADNDYDFLDRTFALNAFDHTYNDRVQTDNSFPTKFTELVTNMSLEDIFQVLIKVDPRFQLHMLVYMGYLGVTSTRENVMHSIGMHYKTLASGAKKGLHQFIEILEGTTAPLQITQVINIPEIIEKALKMRLRKLPIRVGFKRQELVGYTQNAEFKSNLDDVGNQILQLLTQKNHDGKSYSYQQICDFANISVTELVAYLVHLRELAEDRTFEYETGGKVSVNSYQYRLIILQRYVTEQQLTVLSEQEHTLLDLIVLPNQMGTYRRIDWAMSQVKIYDYKFVKKIIEKLEQQLLETQN